MFKRIIEFFKPQAYERDVYGYLTNQISHGYLGIVLTTYFVFAYYMFTGAYPEQIPFVVCIVVGYLLLWEIGVQGWRNWDSIEDTFFVLAGASLYIFVGMDIAIFKLVGWLTILNFIVLIGTFRRTPYYRNKKK